jgi:hypothetical protein
VWLRQEIATTNAVLVERTAELEAAKRGSITVKSLASTAERTRVDRQPGPESQPAAGAVAVGTAAGHAEELVTRSVRPARVTSTKLWAGRCASFVTPATNSGILN